MKYILSILVTLSIIFFTADAQQPSPQLLKEPVSWQFERFTLPPAFAPNIFYKGAEELRFSPGMFNKDSIEYFTYAFVAQLDSTTEIAQNDIRDYLLEYFKGLCSATAKDRKLTVDTTRITVNIKKKKDVPSNEVIYDALLNIFGVFADGALVKLNMEVKVLNNIPAKKTYLLFIASPHEKNDKVWNQLYKIQKDFTIPD